MDSPKPDSTMSVMHTVRFSYRDLLTIMLPSLALIGWGISVHFSNLREHAAQHDWDARMEERVEKLEATVVTMKEQHLQIMGKLEIIQSNQIIVMEALNGLTQGQKGLRKAFENEGMIKK